MSAETFTGAACGYCGQTKRYVGTHHCVACAHRRVEARRYVSRPSAQPLPDGPMQAAIGRLEQKILTGDV